MIIPVSVVIPFHVIKGGEIQLWFQRRSEDGPLDGLLEWPGGKLEAGESPVHAGRRELREEVGKDVELERLVPFQNYTYKYEDRSVTLFTHLLLVKEKWEGDWIELGEDPSGLFGKVPAANEKILLDLSRYFKKMNDNKQWSTLWEI